VFGILLLVAQEDHVVKGRYIFLSRHLRPTLASSFKCRLCLNKSLDISINNSSFRSVDHLPTGLSPSLQRILCAQPTLIRTQLIAEWGFLAHEHQCSCHVELYGPLVLVYRPVSDWVSIRYRVLEIRNTRGFVCSNSSFCIR
jgi:hypothetical protein